MPWYRIAKKENTMSVLLRCISRKDNVVHLKKILIRKLCHEAVLYASMPPSFASFEEYFVSQWFCISISSFGVHNTWVGVWHFFLEIIAISPSKLCTLSFYGSALGCVICVSCSAQAFLLYFVYAVLLWILIHFLCVVCPFDSSKLLGCSEEVGIILLLNWMLLLIISYHLKLIQEKNRRWCLLQNVLTCIYPDKFICTLALDSPFLYNLQRISLIHGGILLFVTFHVLNSSNTHSVALFSGLLAVFMVSPFQRHAV